MPELRLNLHMHTRYSDGSGNHKDIALAAARANLDVVIVTDHNIYVDGPEGYYEFDQQKVLLLVGEEIHDQAQSPQKNHLLILGAQCELAPLADDRKRLLDFLRNTGGIAIIAHPVDPAAPAVSEEDISWIDWPIPVVQGIELWNCMSEFKALLRSKLHAIYYAYQPEKIASGPFPEAVKLWDELLTSGRRISAIAGSDAHALKASMGPLRRELFPYEFHFKTVNMHLIMDSPLTGTLDIDRKLVLDALASGSSFIGYDLPASTNGFRFIANGFSKIVAMGGEIPASMGVTFQIHLPKSADCRLFHNGDVVRSWQNHDTCAYITNVPGAYRVEAFIYYKGKRRTWILSNPIYVI